MSPKPLNVTRPDGLITTVVILQCPMLMRSQASGGNWSALQGVQKRELVLILNH